MTAMEAGAINSLIEEIRGLRADLRVLHTKLFGDDESEDEQGRIPRIEATLLDHGKRLKQQERVTWIGRAVLILAFSITAAIEFLLHLKELVRH